MKDLFGNEIKEKKKKSVDKRDNHVVDMGDSKVFFKFVYGRDNGPIVSVTKELNKYNIVAVLYMDLVDEQGAVTIVREPAGYDPPCALMLLVDGVTYIAKVFGLVSVDIMNVVNDKLGRFANI